MDDLNEIGCLFPDKCLMPGLHMKSECHTVEMLIDEFPDDDICLECGCPLVDDESRVGLCEHCDPSEI